MLLDVKMSFVRVYRRFHEFGGFRLIWQYAKMGMFPLCCKQMISVILKRRIPMEAYVCILEQVAVKLRQKYQPLLDEIHYRKGNEGVHSRKIWGCWMQGMESAPELVKVCYASLHHHLKDREIILLTEENITQYVSLPEDIEKKRRDGIIPMAHYTDMLRLELLVKYGGTWIDSTVLCTGDCTQKSQKDKGQEFKNLRIDSTKDDMLDSDLFLFQQLRKDETRFLGISNWFITSCADNWVLKVLRDMLYQYWRDYDCVVHYYMFHLFFDMIMEKYPEVAAKMPKHGNKIPHYLSRRMGDQYDDEWMQELKKRTCFHKLSYRLPDEILESKGTFYDVVIKQGLMN